MSTILGAVDLGSVVSFVGTAGAVIIAIALAYKAISLGKRAVDKA